MTGLQWLVMTRPRVWPGQCGAVAACSSNYVSPSLYSFSKRRAQLTSNDWAIWLRCSVYNLACVSFQKKPFEWFTFPNYTRENQREHTQVFFKWKRYFIPPKCAIINTWTRALFSLQGKHVSISPAWQVRINVGVLLHKYCVPFFVFMVYKMESLIHHYFSPIKLLTK